MRLIYSIFSFCLLILVTSACQEENLSKTHYQNQAVSPKNPFSDKNKTISLFESGQINDHVSFRRPRFPRPRPCPVLAGCQLPRPEFFFSVVEGKIHKVAVKLYTTDGELYAASGEEYGGKVTYQKSGALASLAVLDDQAEADQLALGVEITYEVGGEVISEEYFDEDSPVNLDDYTDIGQVMYRFPRIPRVPRPRPCPRLAGCQMPAPELHIIVPDGIVLEVAAQLYTDQGDLYACSSEECEGSVIYEEEEALATLNVVNPEIETKSFNLVLQITYEFDGEIISEEIYDENIPINMD
ncbi:MAG: hypothetical protein AAF992_05700 [Bacteroidota bacterium]